MSPDPRPLIAHVVHRFDTGGLENGVVNLINRSDPARYRHAVVALTDITDFAQRVQRPDVQWLALNKPPGQGVWQFPAWTRALRALQPTLVHTRNLGTLELQIPAAWAGVPLRVHGEHGRDLSDPDGTRRRYRWMRRALSPWVHRYVALSDDLQRYLVEGVGIAAHRVERIHNGVDTDRFAARTGPPVPIQGCPWDPQAHWIVGTVGRLRPEKDQAFLLRAFALACVQAPTHTAHWRMALVGDGPQRADLQALAEAMGVRDRVWFAGDRSDVPAILRGLHAFALPSRTEGISNTILESMATGLPVIATAVGGTPELIEADCSGWLVPWGQDGAADAGLAAALQAASDPTAAAHRGAAARARIQAHFSLEAMVQRYCALYDRLLARRGVH